MGFISHTGEHRGGIGWTQRGTGWAQGSHRRAQSGHGGAQGCPDVHDFALCPGGHRVDIEGRTLISFSDELKGSRKAKKSPRDIVIDCDDPVPDQSDLSR